MLSTWLDEHLEMFVRPRLGTIPDYKKPDRLNWHLAGFTSEYIKDLLKLWEAAKRKAANRPILLPGRDVWLFAVIAGMERHPALFRPEISSCVAMHIGDKYKDYYVVDTGYSGTVAKRLQCANFGLITYSGSAIASERDRHQLIFPVPTVSCISQLSGMLEGSPKYWTRATPTIKNDVFSGWKQQVERPTVFARAACITQLIAAGCPVKRRKIPPIKSLGRGI